MTYCVGVRLDEGMILASDSRTHAGVDNYAKFCKMTVFERPGDRVIVDLDATEVRRGDRVVVRTAEGETLAKEIAALNGREVVLASVNPHYEPRILPRGQIRWMARILWVSQ